MNKIWTHNTKYYIFFKKANIFFFKVVFCSDLEVLKGFKFASNIDFNSSKFLPSFIISKVCFA